MKNNIFQKQCFVVGSTTADAGMCLVSDYSVHY